MIMQVTQTEIRNVEFLNSSIMFVHLTNDRTFLVPLDQFPVIKRFPQKKKEILR